ncbi:MAG: tetratricopeptide repeat protein [Rhizobiaceae bacterium]
MKFRFAMVMLAAILAIGHIPPARAQTADSFGQIVDPVASAEVDRAKQLRLPFGKSPDGARKDALRAVGILEAVVAKRPDYYRALFNLGLAWHEAGNYPKSSEAFEKAMKIRLERSIKDISMLNSAGWVSLQNGDYATAITRLQMALKDINQGARFTQSSVYYNLGQVYFLTQRFDEASKYLTIAKDKYGSKQAAETLSLISKTNKLFNLKQSLRAPKG